MIQWFEGEQYRGAVRSNAPEVSVNTKADIILGRALTRLVGEDRTHCRFEWSDGTLLVGFCAATDKGAHRIRYTDEQIHVHAPRFLESIKWSCDETRRYAADWQEAEGLITVLVGGLPLTGKPEPAAEVEHSADAPPADKPTINQCKKCRKSVGIRNLRNGVCPECRVPGQDGVAAVGSRPPRYKHG